MYIYHFCHLSLNDNNLSDNNLLDRNLSEFKNY